MATKHFELPLSNIKDAQGNTHPWYMSGSASIDDTGLIRTSTHLESHIQFSGFTGGMVVTLNDASNRVIWNTSDLQYGVDGYNSPSWLGATPSPRTVDREFRVDPKLYEQTDTISIYLFHQGKNRLGHDLGIAIPIVIDVVKVIVQLCGIAQRETVVTRQSAKLTADGFYGGVVAGAVSLFMMPMYRGPFAVQLYPGRYDMEQLRGLGMPNDAIQSVLVPRGWRVTLFEHAGFQGRSKVLTAEAPALPDFAGITSSLIIDGPVCVFEHEDYTGRRQVLDQGRYDLAQLAPVGNDVISSVKVPLGWRVTLYERAGFAGATRVLTADAPRLPEFNDKASSIVVERLR